MKSYGELWSRIGGGVNLQIFGRPESGEMGFLYRFLKNKFRNTLRLV